jgi:hypothetical protein
MSDGVIDTLARMGRSIGVRGVVEAMLYPLLTPLFTGFAWARSLWASRILLCGRWQRYRGFHPQNAMTSFFYQVQWLNLSRYGRNGTSPLVGLGNYPMSRWFHLTLLSSCLYASAGAASTLGGTLTWVFLHLVWLDMASAWWVVAVVAVFLCSSTAFAMAFTRQNYNILGWMWLPLALYATSNGLWALAALAWLAASLASITVVFAALPLMLVYAVQAGVPQPLLALAPALLKLGLHVVSMLSGGGANQTASNMAKIIGLRSAGVRYRRESMRLRPFSAYFLVIYAVGCGLLWHARSTPVLPLAALAVFTVNQVLLRFADEQSVIVMFVSVFAAELLAAPPSATALLALAIVVNPMPVFLGLCSFERDRSLVRTQTRRPFDHARLQAGLETFLADVPPGSRILFAFPDPMGVYERIFDGYRTLLELPLFVAARRNVHLFPDWHAVAETNYQGAPEFWGRSLEAVVHNARHWQATYVIVYHDSGESLSPAWCDAGFRELASFDWGAWHQDLEGQALWRSARPPCWRLLAVPMEGVEDMHRARESGP